MQHFSMNGGTMKARKGRSEMVCFRGVDRCGWFQVLLACTLGWMTGCGGGEDAADTPAGGAMPQFGGESTGGAADLPAAERGAGPAAGDAARPASGPAPSLTLPLPEANDAPPPKLVSQQTVREEYPDGTLKRTIEVNLFSDNSRVNQGGFVEYYPTGQVFIKGSYQDGRPSGSWQYFHENGQLAKTVVHKEGMLDGTWDVFRADGTKEAEHSYRQGKRDGKWVFFNSQGDRPVRQEQYAAGLEEGTWTTWDAEGRKQLEENYRQGKREGTQSYWHPNQQLAAQIDYRDGKRDGKLIRWNEKGEKIQEVEFRAGEVIPPADVSAEGASPPLQENR
jgi:antitoxin component YwqK of YwqJK toxin-antitoxin module